MLAFWLGGACGYPYIKPPEPEKPQGGGGGFGYRPTKKVPRVRGEHEKDDEEILLLAATIWVTICPTD
jgi:hypothetical protein